LTTTRSPSPAKIALEQALAVRRAEIRREIESIPQAEKDRRWREWEIRHQRQQRALDALRSGARTPVPPSRATAPAPQPTRMWCRPVSLDITRDRRIVDGAFGTLAVLRALAAKGGTIIAAGIAVVRERSVRTIRRHLKQLVATGYIAVEAVRNGRGADIGLSISILDRALPPDFRRAKPAKSAEIGGFSGVTPATPNNQNPEKNKRPNQKVDVEAALDSLPEPLASMLRRLRPSPGT
jgi:hypothetical protein